MQTPACHLDGHYAGHVRKFKQFAPSLNSMRVPTVRTEAGCPHFRCAASMHVPAPPVFIRRRRRTSRRASRCPRRTSPTSRRAGRSSIPRAGWALPASSGPCAGRPGALASSPPASGFRVFGGSFGGRLIFGGSFGGRRVEDWVSLPLLRSAVCASSVVGECVTSVAP